MIWVQYLSHIKITREILDIFQILNIENDE